MSKAHLDNTGRGSLRAPGFGGIPVDYQIPCGERFAHGFDEWHQLPAVTVRESAMVTAMNALTDKPGWEVGIFDSDVVATWRREAFSASPLMSDKAWEWCLAELRDKATDYRQKKYMRVLDTGSCICKSDTLVPRSLAEDFKVGIAPLLEAHKKKQRRPPPASGISNVVDPFMYPLVFGKSMVLQDGGQVDLREVLVSPLQSRRAPKHESPRALGLRGEFEPNPKAFFWSARFQCLPCEVEFDDGAGTDGTGVRIASYVNNLHPYHRPLYDGLEKLISLALKPWNDSLIKGSADWKDDRDLFVFNNQKQRGPVPLRIVTYGAEWENELPSWTLAFNESYKRRWRGYKQAQKEVDDIPESTSSRDKTKRERAILGLEDFAIFHDLEEAPEPTPQLWQMAKKYLESPEQVGSDETVLLPQDWEKRVWSLIQAKAHRIQSVRHPEPGAAISYQDWKSGRGNHRAVVEMVKRRLGGHGSLFHAPTDPEHHPYSIKLEETFRKSGLQIIVKMGGIELTPLNPRHRGDTWHLDGFLNEHIVAVAKYVYDVYNVTECRLAFRQETPMASYCYRHEPYHELRPTQDGPATPMNPSRGIGEELDGLSQIFGFEEGYLAKEIEPWDNLPYQQVGHVSMPQGRLITFPNTIEHRQEPFELVDPTVPGHYRCVSLYLIDPNYRVCSTRNVPPQQRDWWTAAAGEILMQKGLPQELADLITDQYADWSMCDAEADHYRQEMLREHKLKDKAREAAMTRYSF